MYKYKIKQIFFEINCLTEEAVLAIIQESKTNQNGEENENHNRKSSQGNQGNKRDQLSRLLHRTKHLESRERRATDREPDQRTLRKS